MIESANLTLAFPEASLVFSARIAGTLSSKWDVILARVSPETVLSVVTISSESSKVKSEHPDKSNAGSKSTAQTMDRFFIFNSA